MNGYNEKMKDFLEKNNIQVAIKYIGISPTLWSENFVATYSCTIKTAKGEMNVIFHDSIYNTEKLTVEFEDYCQSHYHMNSNSMLLSERTKAIKQWKTERNDAIPNEYDIFSCLQLYDPGNMDNFFKDYGFEIKCVKDMTAFFNIYNDVVREYQDICRCFSKEQIEELRTLQ